MAMFFPLQSQVWKVFFFLRASTSTAVSEKSDTFYNKGMHSRVLLKKKKTNKKSTNVSNLYASMGLMYFISLTWWELSSSYHENIHLRKLWEFWQDATHPAEGWADDQLTWGRFILLGELPTGFIIKFHTKVFTREELKNDKGNNFDILSMSPVLKVYIVMWLRAANRWEEFDIQINRLRVLCRCLPRCWCLF